MNSYTRKALALPVEQLLSRPMPYNRIFGPDIKTVKDLLDGTWGAFRIYSGIGQKGAVALNIELEKLGIDIDEYVACLPATATMPASISKYCRETSIRIKEDLKNLSRREVMWYATVDLPTARRIIKSLDNMGIHHLEPGDRIILETEELPSRIRNSLFLQGYYTEYDTMKLSAKQISKLQALGSKCIPILSHWHTVCRNDL